MLPWVVFTTWWGQNYLHATQAYTELCRSRVETLVDLIGDLLRWRVVAVLSRAQLQVKDAWIPEASDNVLQQDEICVKVKVTWYRKPVATQPTKSCCSTLVLYFSLNNHKIWPGVRCARCVRCEVCFRNKCIACLQCILAERHKAIKTTRSFLFLLHREKPSVEILCEKSTFVYTYM